MLPSVSASGSPLPLQFAVPSSPAPSSLNAPALLPLPVWPKPTSTQPVGWLFAYADLLTVLLGLGLLWVFHSQALVPVASPPKPTVQPNSASAATVPTATALPSSTVKHFMHTAQQRWGNSPLPPYLHFGVWRPTQELALVEHLAPKGSTPLTSQQLEPLAQWLGAYPGTVQLQACGANPQLHPSVLRWLQAFATQAPGSPPIKAHLSVAAQTSFACGKGSPPQLVMLLKRPTITVAP
jgi:hypothetical protein